ncbi:MAG: L-threonylcarbamoyladenylate synthase [Thaumarchaeota archaeon]|nr:L-threonylcarbamoyladenylate synthase [Nitrososphaerota archaeon]MCL5317463.1 L-threonylcarbamoyladenylate synthase [Nitrososphaerota archaeon]
MRKFNCYTDDLTEAADIVKKGGVVIYPTDTLYGIGCNPYNEEAIEKVVRLKRRGAQPLPVLCSDIGRAETLVHLGETGRQLANRFWPGGLTIVAKAIDKNLPSRLTGSSGTLGVRVPDHQGALKLISLCGGCLIGTSANISGEPALETPEEILEVFDEKFDALIYGGEKSLGTPSSVVDVVDGNLRIVREGLVPSERILQSIRDKKSR